MTSDSTPAFEIEKEALKTEIETGIQAGVDHLEAKTAKRKDADKYHNTRHLLKQYRKVAYAIQISEADMNVRMEMEHGTRLSTLEVNAELAGVDLSGSKLEGYARTVIRSKNMLQIIDNALNTVRMDPDHGELMYQVLYLTYFSKKKPANREVILAELDRQGFPMSMVTYHSYGARFGNRRNAIRLGGRHSTSPNRVCKFCQRSNSFGGQPCVRLGKFDCTHFGAHRSMELYQASIRGSGEIHSRRRSDLHSSSRIRYRGIRKHIKCL